jgi:hypothetical protein
VREQLQSLTEEMRSWQTQAQMGAEEVERIRSSICCFNHTTGRADLQVAGVDGSGNFPMLTYADSFIYLSVAQATVYESDRLCGLKKVAPIPEPVIQFHWLLENEAARQEASIGL